MYNQYKVNVSEGTSGKWAVQKFIVHENDPGLLYYAIHGRPVSPGTYTKLVSRDSYDPVMSDTPAEVSDHFPIIHRATGRCLINGLGLGVVLKALLNQPSVTHVDVVEIEQDVINLVWPTYQNDSRACLHHADAFTINWPKGTRWDCAWHDIWPSICTDNLPEITRLKRKYASRVAWQGAWVEHLLRSYRGRGY